MFRLVLAGFWVVMLVVGCGESKPPEKTVLDPMLETKQKARDVEKTLKEGAQKRSKQIQQEEQGEKE